MEATTEIRDIMSTAIISVGPEETIAKVKEKITDHQIHHIPVVEDGKVIGMISTHDIHKMEHHFTLFKNPEAEDRNRQLFSTILAKEIMTSPVVKVKENEPVSIAVDLLLENMFHALPVVDKDDKLIGMITTYDLIRHALDGK